MVEARDALRAWTLMDELVLDLYATTKRLPAESPEDLAASLRGVAVRAALRIVRGLNGPRGEMRASFRAALGLLAELRYHLYLARRVGVIDLRRYRSLCLRHERVLKCLREILEEIAPVPVPGSTPGTVDGGAPAVPKDGFAALDLEANAAGCG